MRHTNNVEEERKLAVSQDHLTLKNTCRMMTRENCHEGDLFQHQKTHIVVRHLYLERAQESSTIVISK